MRRLPSVVGFLCLVAASACETPAPTTNSAEREARTSLAPAVAPTCGAECLAILRAAVAWVSETRSIPPARVLLDSVGSGRASYRGPRVVPRSVLNDLRALTGIGGQGTVDRMARCFGSPFSPVPVSCRPLADKIMVTLYAPAVSADNPTEASLYIRENWYIPPQPQGRKFWAINGYQLKLERAASGWRVVGARLVFQT